MAIGDSPFLNVTSDMQAVWSAQAITVQVTPSQAAQAVPRDRFGRPTGTPPASVNVQIVMSHVVQNIQPTPEGGKPVETIEFFVLPGSINENDTVSWNGHQFRTSSVWPSAFGGMTQVLFCKADRMVGT